MYMRVPTHVFPTQVISKTLLLFTSNSPSKVLSSVLNMGFLSGGISQTKEKLRRTISPRKGNVSTYNDVPKGHVPVYVGDMHRRFVVPLCYLNHPLFQELLHLAEEEFGYNHPMGGLTIPCHEDYFLSLTSQLNSSHMAVSSF